MAFFADEDGKLGFDIRPVEVRDHLCGRFVKFAVFASFNGKTAVRLPDLNDDDSFLELFQKSIEAGEDNAYSFAYVNDCFAYLREPLYNIHIGIEKRRIVQLSLFDFENAKPARHAQIKLNYKQNFDENCCWEDFMDYVMLQQNIAKVVNSKCGNKFLINIENGCLNDLLAGKETIGGNMTVCCSIQLSMGVEEFIEAYSELKAEFDSIKPASSTIIDSFVEGQKQFDFGPEAKPSIDTRRTKRLEFFKQRLDEISIMPEQSKEQEYFGLSASIEYFIVEELRRVLKQIFKKYDDAESIVKAIRSASDEVGAELEDFADVNEILSAVLNSRLISESIVEIVAKIRSGKDFMLVFKKISEENSLKRLFKTFSIKK